MRVLADENVHASVVRTLRTMGHDVEWIAETMPAASDEAILARQDIGEMALVTYDRDFGELIFRHDAGWPHTILYSRLGRADPSIIAVRVAAILAEPPPPHHIITILRDKDRRRPFEGKRIDG